MSSPPPPPPPADAVPAAEVSTAELQTLIPRYTSKLWRSLVRLLPPPSTGLLTRIWSLYSRGSPTRTLRRKPGLPLPLRSAALALIPAMSETSGIVCALDAVLDHVLSCLHKIQKNLQFWQARAEGTDARKVYFMVFERGPSAFIQETAQLIRIYRTGGYSMQSICLSAASSISEKISILTTLQCCLATFLAQVYTEVDKYGDLLTNDPAKALPSLLVAIDSLFSKLEVSLRNPRKSFQWNPSLFASWDDSFSLSFEKLPEILHEREHWNHTEIMDAINLIYQNLQRLDDHASSIVLKCQKPRRITLYWLQYTCGAVGLSICTGWLLRHSSFFGSPDIDNWITEAKESAAGFWDSHVEQPLLSIRDELFETFRGRHKGVIEAEEVQLTADSLHRMLLAFSEQTKGQKFPENASDQEMLEIVMSRYEKELMHPIQNLFSGEIARAMLIQIQKLKLDLETAMLELDQILKANEINFAILAALPAFFLSVILLMLVRAWVLQDKGAEGRGRMARLQRRLLVAEVEKKIMQFQTYLDEGFEEDAQCMFGQVLYSLDRLYKAVEKHASDAGEWPSLRQDILDVGNPRMKTEHKLILTSRMGGVYESMLPLARKH